MRVINPATGEVVRDYDEHRREAVDLLVERAAGVQRTWRRTGFGERAEHLRRAAQVLRERRGHHAELMTLEMGKPVAAGEAEVDKCASVCDFYAENGERFLSEEPIATDGRTSGVRYDPLGVVLAIMPWNFPFWQVFRFAAPALMAGNTGLLKHASNVPGCALAIEEVMRDAGFPEGVFTTLLIGSSEASRLIGKPEVAAVTLTGSEEAGLAVATEAGRFLKKTVLELGGSDPFIVLGDADPVAVAKQATVARTINSGQSCIAAKRFIVVETIGEAFEEALRRAMESLVVGDPMDRATEVGPLARGDLVDVLHDQVKRSVAAGARILCGGRRVDRAGFFYAPTVLAGVEPGMAAFDEETFGPVAAVTRARDQERAIELANASPYGLGASIWSADVEAAKRLVPRIQAGSVFVNGIVKSDPRLPFGGIKRSGYGRELGACGIREFVNVKTFWVG